MRNRVAVLHGVNLDALDRRPAEHYGGLTYTRLEFEINRFAEELGLAAQFFHTNFEGEFVEQLHMSPEFADGLLLNPGAWTHYAWAIRDALEVSGPAGRGGAPLRRQAARGVPVGVRAGGHLRGDGQRPGPGRLPGRARAAQGGAGVSRADRVAARLAERELDLLLVTDLVNLRYLTGFTGTSGLAVVGADVRRFVTDFRYVERARAELDGFELELAPLELRAALAEGWPAGDLRVGFEDQHVSVRRHAELRETLPDRLSLVGAGGLVEAERAIKEPAELEAIRAAAQLTDDVYAWLAGFGLVGRTEREVALALEHEMRLRGAEDPAFPSIVAAAENGALPHALPRDVEIGAGTLVTIDAGARVDGYCSDCTRTWATGPLDDDLAAIYALVLQAQEAALAAVRPGPEGREVDAVARDIITAAGHGDHFGHGLGHGVGLDIHEGPRLARTAEGRLAAGQVVTVEPGVYVPGRGGVRIEDLVVVTDDGHELLSHTPKALTVVG